MARVSRGIGWRLAAVALLTLVGAAVERWVGLPVALWVGLAGAVVVAADMAWRVRLPTTLDAAMEVDRQWGLHELLSSALMMSEAITQDVAFAVAVAERAAEAARRINVRQFNGGDYGARQWIAALLLLGIVPMVHTSITRDEAGRQIVVTPGERDTAEVVAGESGSSATQRMAGAGEGHGTARPDSAVTEEKTEIGTGMSDRRDSRGDMAGASAGGGLATGGSKASQVAPEGSSGESGRNAMGNGGSGSGAGPADRGRGGASEGSGTVAGAMLAQPGSIGVGSSLAPRAQLWQQQIPAEYQDVLKAYFER